MLLLLFICILGSTYCLGEQSEDKMMLSFESPIYVVSGEDAIDTSELQCESNGSVAWMFGSFKFLKPMDKLTLEITLEKESSGRHEMIFTYDVGDICKEMDDEESIYKDYFSSIAIPETCPIEAQTIVVNDLVVNVKKLGVKNEHCGEYICTLKMSKKVGDDSTTELEPMFTLKMDVMMRRAD